MIMISGIPNIYPMIIGLQYPNRFYPIFSPNIFTQYLPNIHPNVNPMLTQYFTDIYSHEPHGSCPHDLRKDIPVDPAVRLTRLVRSLSGGRFEESYELRPGDVLLGHLLRYIIYIYCTDT